MTKKTSLPVSSCKDKWTGVNDVQAEIQERSQLVLREPSDWGKGCVGEVGGTTVDSQEAEARGLTKC